MALSIVGRSKRASHGVVDKCGPRRRHDPHDIERRPGDERRDAATLDDMSDETDGLMTERSIGHEQGEIDLSLDQLTVQRRSELVLHRLVLTHAAHKREMERCKVADGAALG